MITNDRQLATTRRKLTSLEGRAAELQAQLQNGPGTDAVRVTLHSYRQLVRQLREEISRYELGALPASRDRLENDGQVRNTEIKLRRIQELIKARESKLDDRPSSHADRVTLASLRESANQLSEEIAWYEARRRVPVESASGL